MSNDYTPTMRHIEDTYAYQGEAYMEADKWRREFRRALAAHDAEVAAKPLEELIERFAGNDGAEGIVSVSVLRRRAAEIRKGAAS